MQICESHKIVLLFEPVPVLKKQFEKYCVLLLCKTALPDGIQKNMMDISENHTIIYDKKT